MFCRKNAAAIHDLCRKWRRKPQRCLPQQCRRRQRPSPQEMPQQPTTGQRRPAERSPTAPKLTRKRPAFRGGLLASSGACANLCCRVLRTGAAGQVSCFCALRVRAAPPRLVAPVRPPINRLLIRRRVCLRLLCLGWPPFELKQGMLLFQFLP
jgi:hypothetical protein